MVDPNFKARLAKEFEYINFPEESWVEPSPNQYDVVVVGAGMAGLAASFALKRLGISKIKIFDSSPKGYEGPWATYARMPTLRSGKELTGPSLEFPLITFRAWYEAYFGQDKWNQLGKIPTKTWMDYLRWFREVIDVSIENDHTLKAIQPSKQGLNLIFDGKQISTTKVILATGRGGFGGSKLPHFINKLPLQSYARANDQIDFAILQNKKVGIIGGGASGFDAAAAALEAGSLHVDILLRRQELPYINKAASLTYSGFFEGYYHLNDEKRWKLMEICYRNGIPPPYEAVERIVLHPKFAFVRSAHIQDAKWENPKVYLETSRGSLTYDFLIFATGFDIDISNQPELKFIIDKIQLWSNRKSIQGLAGPDWFHRSPYLGPHFEFIAKSPEEALHLKNIYCFNYAATLSHGLLSGDIPGIGVGAARLARGIASDFFGEGWTNYYRRLEEYQSPELSPNLR